MSTYKAYIVSFVCGYIVTTTKVTIGHIKYIQKSKYKKFKYINV
jgi:hypothetical protein